MLSPTIVLSHWWGGGGGGPSLICQELSNLFFVSIENFFLNDPELQDEVPLSYLSHKEMYEATIRKATVIFRKIREMQVEGKDGVDNYM